MSKSAVKISLDLLSNPLCEQDQDFLNMVTALDTAMKRMDAFNQEKVTGVSAHPPHSTACGILVPQPGIKPFRPSVEVQSLTTGPPGNFQGD